MLSTVPISTDHIYKFFALFGLFLFISSGLSFVYLRFYSNELLYKEWIEFEMLKVKTDPSQEEETRRNILEHKIKVDRADKKTFSWVLGGIAVIGVFLMFGGFSAWAKKIQPMQDTLVNLQIEKLKAEIRNLNR
jgi:hypothetical protein